VRFPRGGVWLLLAAVAVALAVYAGPNQPVATAAVVGGLIALGLFVVSRARRFVADPRAPVVPRPYAASTPFRASLRAGRSGRSEVVVLLDELERRSGASDRPMTPSTEVARLRAMSRAEFRGYVQQRLDAIEAMFR
jgi:hypothetical protein